MEERHERGDGEMDAAWNKKVREEGRQKETTIMEYHIQQANMHEMVSQEREPKARQEAAILLLLLVCCVQGSGSRPCHNVCFSFACTTTRLSCLPQRRKWGMGNLIRE